MLWWRGEHSLRRDSPRPPRRSGPGRPAAGTGPQGPLRREPPRDHAGDRPAGAFRPRPDRGGRAATDAGQSPPQGPTRHRSGRGHRPRTQQRLRDVLRRPGGTGTPARHPGRRRTTSRRSRRKGVETMSTTRPDQIHHAVREHYAAAARAATDPAPAAPVVDAIGAGQYDQQAAQSLPEAALAASLGCRNQHEAGITNAEFLHGTIEDIPLPDASVDVIISNCVINLAVDKDRVLREAYRVLRPGGRLAISDIVLRRRLPAPLGNLVALWTGCVTGALLDADYQAKLHAAGFQAADIQTTHVFDRADITRIADDPAIAGAIPPDIDPEATITALDGAVTSAFVRARKPGP